MFQSAPGIKAGGNVGGLVGARSDTKFQSAPGIKAGGNSQPGRLPRQTTVSIRPRHQGRGKQPTAAPPGTAAKLFQSAPGIKAGGNNEQSL